MVFEHRLVAEKYLLNDLNSVDVNGKRYLSKDYSVHHMDMNRLNNAVDNLVVMRKEQHSRLHNFLRKTIKDKKTGRIETNINPLTFMSRQELLDETNDFLAKEGIV